MTDDLPRPVISLALLTDENRQWRPSHFGYEKFGCRISFDFPVIKLLDYQQRQDELANHENPFAVVVAAHLQTLATRKIPSARYVAKLSLVKALYRRGFSRQEIIELFHFIDWIMILPQEMSEQFKTDLIRFEEEARMPYVTSIERLALQKGHQKGRQEGRQEGKQEGVRESIVETLQVRFERVAPELIAILEQIQELQVLRDIHKLAVTASSLTAFTERLSEYV
jgi:predicted transposase YdaD